MGSLPSGSLRDHAMGLTAEDVLFWPPPNIVVVPIRSTALVLRQIGRLGWGAAYLSSWGTKILAPLVKRHHFQYKVDPK